jgi:hypothetical protein
MNILNKEELRKQIREGKEISLFLNYPVIYLIYNK